MSRMYDHSEDMSKETAKTHIKHGEQMVFDQNNAEKAIIPVIAKDINEDSLSSLQNRLEVVENELKDHIDQAKLEWRSLMEQIDRLRVIVRNKENKLRLKLCQAQV